MADILLRRIQRPSKLIYDSVAKKYFLGSDFNKIVACYRSPHGGGFFTKTSERVQDLDSLGNDRKIRPTIKAVEEKLNAHFDIYRQTYYPNGVSSVYFWDFADGEGWGAAVLFRNSAIIKDSPDSREEFVWDGIHIVMHLSRSTPAVYRIKSTILLTLNVRNPQIGEASWGGRMIKVTSMTRPASESNATIFEDTLSQAAYVTTQIEENEKTLGTHLREISLPKTRQILNTLRLLNPVYADIHNEIVSRFTEVARKERSESRMDSRAPSRVSSHAVSADLRTLSPRSSTIVSHDS
eukprot:Protomagalhaensia_sp_Gyna_25__4083@NODE_369_length_3675_cov_37_727998_g283_i0_p2_GENE_NODE_369_length_3675_cov_37_727998_g283_i0NODE_369_length_3675_cov_37_727998_g283_i0_p2_ORF_typecomplete_len295_score25_93F_actin_cap_B/PF01115_17/1_9e36_NODE_369_length_3675_cov_37_727998_g283_i027863670